MRYDYIYLKKPLFVIDIEATGLSKYPKDIPTEIALTRINTDLSIEQEFNYLIDWSVDDINENTRIRNKVNNCYWSRELSAIKYRDLVETGRRLDQVWEEFKKIVDGNYLTSYNVSYDIKRFIIPIHEELGMIDFDLTPDPMLIATKYVNKTSKKRYKWSKLIEATSFYNILPDNEDHDFHRAAYDCTITAMLIVEMIKRSHYIFEGIIDEF